MWWIWAVETDVPWPNVPTDVTYNGRVFNLAPASATEDASIAVDGPLQDGQEISRDIHAFLSVLCWVDRNKAVLGRSVGNPGWRQPMRRMVPLAREFHQSRSNFDFLPIPPSPKARLALAFHRAALSTESVENRFLQYFRILELVHGDSIHRPKKVDELLAGFTLPTEITKTCDAILSDGRAVGKAVSAYARNAVAHGYAKNVIDPDDRTETYRVLNEVLPIVKFLAVRAMEEDLKIPSRGKYYHEHVYEVEGLQGLLAAELIESVNTSSEPPTKIALPFDKISIGTRNRRYASLEDLTIVDSAALFGCVVIIARSSDELVNAVVKFDLRTRIMDFQPTSHLGVVDNGSVSSPLHQIDVLALRSDWFANGELHIWTGPTLLGRKTPYLPINIDVRTTQANLTRISDELKQQAEVRRVTGPDV